MYGHEPNPPVQEEDFYSILGGMEAVVEFLWVSDTCAGYLLRYVAYFYRFYVLYAMYHPLLCLAEASYLEYPF